MHESWWFEQYISDGSFSYSRQKKGRKGNGGAENFKVAMAMALDGDTSVSSNEQKAENTLEAWYGSVIYNRIRKPGGVIWMEQY